MYILRIFIFRIIQFVLLFAPMALVTVYFSPMSGPENYQIMQINLGHIRGGDGWGTLQIALTSISIKHLGHIRKIVCKLP